MSNHGETFQDRLELKEQLTGRALTPTETVQAYAEELCRVANDRDRLQRELAQEKARIVQPPAPAEPAAVTSDMVKEFIRASDEVRLREAPTYHDAVEVGLRAALAVSVSGSGWVSVKDRLPEDGECVLAGFGIHDELISVVKYRADSKSGVDKSYEGDFCAFESSLEEYAVIVVPTDWMPLPTPPEDKSDGSV